MTEIKKETIGYVDPSVLTITDEYKASPRYKQPLSKSFIESLKLKTGILLPVVVTKRDDKVYVISGNRRVMGALQLAEENFHVKVPIVIREYDADDERTAHFVENFQREDNSPLTTAYEFACAIEGGMSYEAVGQAANKTHQTVRNFVALATMPKAVRDSVERGLISPTAAFAFNNKSYKVENGQGAATWNAKKIEESLSVLKEEAKFSGGKIKTESAKSLASGKTSTGLKSNVMRKIAMIESTPSAFALVLLACVGDISLEEARSKHEDLGWFVEPLKRSKVQKEKIAGTKKAKKAKIVTEAIVDSTITDDDISALFNQA